ncbi:MAG: PAS domain-containing sensor histidine kinase [Proteobacteria bacterium]|nr:MAG: PAS domain-containing sensor histidine kinase [Pseudomonadota bacterium]
MDDSALKPSVVRWLPVLIIGVLLIISLTLLYRATPITNSADVYGGWLVYLNLFILLVLAGAIFSNLIRLIHHWHTRQAGSRFTIRLMSGFLVLSLLPAVVIAYFAMNFIGKSVALQLDNRVASALDDSVELATRSLEVRSQIYLESLEELARNFSNFDSRLGVATLDKSVMISLIERWRVAYNAHEVILINEESQRFEVISVVDDDRFVPFFKVKDLLRNMISRKTYYHIEPINDNADLFTRVALRITYGPDNKVGILTAMLPFSEREQILAGSVNSARQEFRSLVFNHDMLKTIFRVVLLIIMILTVLFSLWAAFIFSRQLTRPVRDLVEGTLAVASGDLQKKLPVSDRDDFSLVARSFNTMTKRLSSVQQEREQARYQLQQEHDYLYVVLEHLSSGVVTLDEHWVIRRVNTAASQILGYALQEQVGTNLYDAWSELPALQPFLQALQPWLEKPQNDWQAEINLVSDEGRKVLVCRGAGLPDDSMQQKAYVLVFEDVTDVVQAEHDAAWGEVARRLAHEIKNPLTPIQLSAERLSRKLGSVLDSESNEFLKRMTGTIIHQVDTLKAMVNAFSDYAKVPMLTLRPVNLNHLIREVADLYFDNPQQVKVVLDLEEDLPELLLDAHRLRQLLVNLVKNALEAIEDYRSDGCIIIKTRGCMDKAAPVVVLSLQDNGPGIPAQLLPHLFEPYVSSKHKGTGLGLAIVKKIVEEHAGSLSARNATPQGALITVRFPIKAPQAIQVKGTS